LPRSMPATLPAAIMRRALSTSVSALPYRIRAPLARLRASKDEQPAFLAGGLGDGESLEGAATYPDYVALALRSRVYDNLSETPLQHLPALSERLDATVHLKREDLLPTFTFYARCAINDLSSYRAAGETRQLITSSVGSRGHALAWAANRLGMRLTVVMPSVTPASRREAVQRLGATVLIRGTTVVEAHAEAAALATAENLVPVGTHERPPVVAACATVGLEILRQHGAAVAAAAAPASSGMGGSSGGGGGDGGSQSSSRSMPQLDAVFVSVGGGSLLAGVASAIKNTSPHTRVIAVEPRNADVLSRSLLCGHRVTDEQRAGEQGAEGVFVSQIGPEIFRVCDALVDDVLLVDDADILAAVQDTFLDTRAVLEPAGAIALAGLKRHAAAHPTIDTPPTYVAIGSDANNVELSWLAAAAAASAKG